MGLLQSEVACVYACVSVDSFVYNTLVCICNILGSFLAVKVFQNAVMSCGSRRLCLMSPWIAVFVILYGDTISFHFKFNNVMDAVVYA